MMGTLVERMIVASERDTGESADFMRDIYRASKAAFWKFGMFMPLSRHRRAATAEAKAVAGLVGSLSEDCGTCVQIHVNLARKEGVGRDILQAVLDGKPGNLAPDLAAVYEFAQSVVTASPDAGERSDQLKELLGEEAVVDLSLAIATARLFPIVKRGLGYGVSCSLVQVRA
jgi:AhpD family alkylhydroperoxidase